MSAFFVSENTIHDVITTLHPAWMTGDEMATDLGRQLIQMNIDAMQEGYEIDAEELAEYQAARDEYTFVESTDVSEAQLLKSLNCFVYQCAEGDVPKTNPLFARCERHGDLLTLVLAKGRQKLRFGKFRPFVKGYDEAKWGR